MSIEHLREIVARLQVSAGALAALAATLEARMSGRPLDPRIKPHIDAIAAAFKLPETMQGVDSSMLGPILAEIRTFALQNASLLFPGSLEPGWAHTDVKMLQAAGDASAGFAPRLKQTIAPLLDGLLCRLESVEAKFLDIGVGAGVLSIGVARQWPRLRIVGIDPWEPALTLARENIDVAGLTQRIELRRQGAEALSDSRVFDLAWLPGVFVPEQAINVSAARVYEALRPGGWLLLAMIKRGTDPLTEAVACLRTALFGGCLMSIEAVQTRLREVGFTDVRSLPSQAKATVTMIAARREL
jgi:precorrin-6B methylase 2